MKTLIVCYSKMKGFGGGFYAALATVNAFAALGDEVTLLFPADRSDERAEHVDPSVRQIAVTDPLSRCRKLLRAVFGGSLHRFAPAFRDLTDRERFDRVVFQSSKCSRGLLRLAREKGAQVITVHDNYEYEYTRDNFPWYQLLYLLPAVVKAEKEAVRGSDLNLVLSIQDRDLLRKRYDPDRKARFEVLGVFEYGERPLPDLPDRVEDPVFAITGNLGARQTLDSLLPWLERYWPVLRKRLPEARLLVAGKDPGSVLKERLKAAGADLVDTPRDMGEVLVRARYYICPTCKGGGVKLRVMDGFRYGLPVLVHRISARGYEPFLDRSMFVYDTPESFGEALDRMLETDADRPVILETYSAYYSFRSGVSRLKKILSEP